LEARRAFGVCAAPVPEFADVGGLLAEQEIVAVAMATGLLDHAVWQAFHHEAHFVDPFVADTVLHAALIAGERDLAENVGRGRKLLNGLLHVAGIAGGGGADGGCAFHWRGEVIIPNHGGSFAKGSQTNNAQHENWTHLVVSTAKKAPNKTIYRTTCVLWQK